ncbi:hypothetical protein [Dactylosporangium sp. CA-139066]|uniref:hypothetical protein n=1 Tax=Dactylosporangium sp. CA-139066 TaxID=3239930 RepID=UPI003D8C90F8
MRWRSGPALDATADRLAALHLERARAELLRHRVYRPALANGARLAGDAPSDVDLSELAPAEVYAAMPTGRLVVLAGPVSGKTVFLLRLAEAYDGGPVPVVVPVAGWDPGGRDVADWVAARVAVDFPELGGPDARGVTPARRLVAAGRVLPLLDGLHELPAAARAAALERLDAYAGPFVLTSDPHAYREAVRAAGDPAGTAAVELRQLRLTELDAYRRADRPADDGGGAEDVHADTDIRAALDRVFSDAYGPPSPYRPDEARRWLAFIARGFDRAHQYDIPWAGLPVLIRPAPAAAVGALLAVVAFEASLWPVYHLCERLRPGFLGDLRATMNTTFDAATFGLGGVASPLTAAGHLKWLAVVAALGALMWAAGTRPGRDKPRRAAGRRIGDRRAVIAGARKGLLWGVYLAAVELLSYWLRLPEDAWRVFEDGLARHGIELTAGIVVTFMAALVPVAAAIGAVRGRLRRAPGAVVTDAPPPDPGRDVRASRRRLPRFVIVAIAVSAGLWPPYVLLLDLTYGLPSRPGIAVTAVLGALFGAGAGGFAAATFLPWPRFAVARLYLAARGRLPLRLIRFLDDACERQVLEPAGGAYRYRDPVLRDRLVSHG